MAAQASLAAALISVAFPAAVVVAVVSLAAAVVVAVLQEL
jgi:hypothetical protein